MAINADTLLDRMMLKASLRKWRLVAILAIVIAVVVAIEGKSPNSPIEKSYIARLNVDGILGDDSDRDEAIRELTENNKVKAVIVRIDTPGGSALAGEELYLQLKQLSKAKPVVAVMRTMATSAGYMTALGADYIFAREATITGSIGVMIESVEISDLAEKIGVKPVTIKSAPLKGTPSYTEPLTPEARQAAQSMIDDFFGLFVDMVAERRKLPRNEVLRIADGRAYTGRQAYELKLVDAMGGEEEAIDWLEKNKGIPADLDIKDIEEEPDRHFWLDQIAGTIAHQLVPDLKGKLDGLVSIWHPSFH